MCDNLARCLFSKLCTKLLLLSYPLVCHVTCSAENHILPYRPRDGSGQTRLGSGWAGLLGGLGHEKCRALARRSGLARSAQPAQKPVGLTRPAKTPNFAPQNSLFGGEKDGFRDSL